MHIPAEPFKLPMLNVFAEMEKLEPPKVKLTTLVELQGSRSRLRKYRLYCPRDAHSYSSLLHLL